MPEPLRDRHRVVYHVLGMLDAGYLADVECYFGGGTRIVLELEEYRESIDIDFLCASRAGYRVLRSGVTQGSLGEVFKRPVRLLREVRADMYGIRCFLDIDGQPVKFEIVAEGRIPLSGDALEAIPVAVLDRKSSIAEKLLANADRGRDQSTYSRDIIDLAFMAVAWPKQDWIDGFELADMAYGAAVRRELNACLDVIEEGSWRRRCIEALSVSNARRLSAGVRALRKL